MKKLPLILGGTAVAGLAYFLYQQNQTPAANTASPTVNTSLALPPATDASAAAAVSAVLKKANMTIGTLQTPTQDNSDAITGILGTLPGTVLHYWPNTDVLALVSPINGHPTPLFAPPPGEGYVSTLDLLFEVSMGGKTVIYQQVPGAVPTNAMGGAPFVAPVYTYFRLIEPTAPVPAGWQVFFAPKAADTVYRAAGINVAAMLNVPIPASSQLPQPSGPYLPGGPGTGWQPPPMPVAPAQPLAKQVAFLQGIAGFTAEVNQGSPIIQLYPGIDNQPLLGSWSGKPSALSILYAAAAQGFQIYFAPPMQVFEGATLMGNASQGPSSAGMFILVAPGTPPPSMADAILLFNANDVIPALSAAGINPDTISATPLPVSAYPTANPGGPGGGPIPWIMQPGGGGVAVGPMPTTTLATPASPDVQAQVLQALVGRSASPDKNMGGLIIFVLDDPTDPSTVGMYPALNLANTASKMNKFLFHDDATTYPGGGGTREAVYLADNAVAPTPTSTLAFAPGDINMAALTAGIDLSGLADVPMMPQPPQPALPPQPTLGTAYAIPGLRFAGV